MAARPVVVLLDPHHPYAGRFSAVAHEQYGLDTVCLWTDTTSWDRARSSEHLQGGGRVVAHYRVRRDALDHAARELSARHDVAGVLPHIEYRVAEAITLAEALGVLWADAADLRRFRDKAALKEHIRSQPGAPRINASTLVGSTDEVRDALTTGSYDRFVLKPNDGMNNNRIGFFDASVRDADLDAYLDQISGTDAVMEEFLDGDEYCVNGQADTDGTITTLSVYRTHHTSANGRTQLASHFDLVRHDSPLFGMLAAYVSDVLTAAGLRRSPFHLELMVDAAGPCLIEVGARLGGVAMAYDVAVAHHGAVDAFELAVAHYLRREPVREQRSDWAAYDQQSLRIVCGVSAVSARAATWTGFREVERLPGFVHWVARPRPGQRIRPTVDLATSPWQATMSAPDAAGLEAADAAVRRLVGWNAAPIDHTRAGLAAHATAVRAAARLRLVPGLIRSRPVRLDAAPDVDLRDRSGDRVGAPS